MSQPAEPDRRGADPSAASGPRRVDERSRKRADIVIPGEVVTTDEAITVNAGRDRVELTVENTGDRPIQVGSHYHFAQTNPALDFDRALAHGFRLDIPAGTSVRFEPGLSMTVALVRLAGRRVVPGLRLDG